MTNAKLFIHTKMLVALNLNLCRYRFIRVFLSLEKTAIWNDSNHLKNFTLITLRNINFLAQSCFILWALWAQ